MRDTRFIYLLIVMFAILGCKTPRDSTLAVEPEAPAEWKVIVERKTGCPDVTGRYELIPKIAVMQKDGAWRISVGTRFDYALLLPFNRVKVDEWKRDEKTSANSGTSLVLAYNSKKEEIRIISPINDSDKFATRVISRTKNDYSCKAGSLVFPEFKIKGGTEGSTLSGGIYRRATITLDGGLLFYEKVQGQDTLHKYYLFKMIES
jgi:hypothetical protein